MNIEQYRMKKKMGIALRRFIFTEIPCRRHEAYFGCDREFMRAFLEYQFEDWMWWDNFGKWQIDHIVPLCNFNLLEDDEMFLCWNWINLRPLAKTHNKARTPYEHAVQIMRWRKKHFPDNDVVGRLLMRATNLMNTSRPALAKWELFMRK